MKTSILLAAAGAAALLATAPAAFAQPLNTPPAGAATAPAHSGDWTLKQREDWINDHINKAHDEKDIDGREADRAHHELDLIRDDEGHMRDHHDGQLTDNETTTLEARLDDMASKIKWAHENAYQRPW